MIGDHCWHSKSSSPAIHIIPWPIGVTPSPSATGLQLPAAAVIRTESSLSTSLPWICAAPILLIFSWHIGSILIHTTLTLTRTPESLQCFSFHLRIPATTENGNCAVCGVDCLLMLLLNQILWESLYKGGDCIQETRNNSTKNKVRVVLGITISRG